MTESSTNVSNETVAGAPSGEAVSIRAVEPEGPLVDVMNGSARWEIPVLDHGFVALVDVMPRLIPEGKTADSAIVQAARVSYGEGTKKVNEDRGLVRYLLRHRHTTPFEMVEFKFHVAMPIFIARQWIRHRTANVNEYSARYSIVPDRFYRPSVDNIRKQSSTNRQGGEESIEVKTAEDFISLLEDSEKLYSRYLELTEKGVWHVRWHERRCRFRFIPSGIGNAIFTTCSTSSHCAWIHMLNRRFAPMRMRCTS